MRPPPDRPDFLVCALLGILLALAPAVGIAQNAPPIITAPPTAIATAGRPFSITISALSADPTRTVVLTGPAPACGLSFTSSPGVGQATGTYSGTPLASCLGSFSVTFTANDGVSSSSHTMFLTIVPDEADAPVVTAPATQSVVMGGTLSFTVSAFDPDGDPIASFTAAPLPSGATFTTNATNTSGTFLWTPNLAQTGTFNITFTAANALAGTASTTISVHGDRAPVVTAPATITIPENQTRSFTVSAVDPDGQAITSLTAAGTPLGAGATFTTNATNTSGTFTWTPGFTQAGSYTVTFTASNDLSGSATTTVTVCNGCDRAPVVIAPASASTSIGVLLTFTVSAADPDGDAIVGFVATGSAITAGGSFATNAAHTSGTFTWTPGAEDTGSYSVTFTATNTLTGTATTSITTCQGCDRAPLVTAPAGASGVEGSPITFTVIASDPDGDPIATLAMTPASVAGATFAANATNTAGTFSWTPSAGQAGFYAFTFTATNTLSGSATTTINVMGALSVRTFTVKNNQTIRLKSGKAQWCAFLEPVGFNVLDIDVNSVVLRWPVTGVEIGSIPGKTVVVGDGDGNSIQDIEFCFAKESLRTLFASLSGRNDVFVILAGRLLDGTTFSGVLAVEVIASGGNMAASVTPNPLQANGTLSFRAATAGPARIRLFDASGRLVRTVDLSASGSDQRVRLDGRDEAGKALPSGIYFYRVEGVRESATGRFVIAR